MKFIISTLHGAPLKGVEIELNYSASDKLELYGSLGYVDTEFLMILQSP